MRSRQRWIWPVISSVVCGTIITLLLAIVGPWWESRYIPIGPTEFVRWVVARPGNNAPKAVMANQRWLFEIWVRDYDGERDYHHWGDTKRVDAFPHLPY